MNIIETRREPKIKIAAAILAILLTFDYTAWATPSISAASLISKPEARPEYLTEKIEIPEAIGSVRERYEAPEGSASTIIHIQDAHSSLEAQENIKKILHHLHDEYGMNLVFVEGAVSKMDAGRLHRFKDDAANQLLAERLAKEGVVSGSELYLLDESLKKEKIAAFGAEDLTLYQKNIDSFRNVFANQAQANHTLQKIKSEISSAASKILSKKLKIFFREWLSYQDAKGEILRHLNQLKTCAAEELRLDFKNPRLQTEWPQLVRFFNIQEIESHISMTQVKAEQQAMLQWLNENKIGQDYANAVADYVPGKGFQDDRGAARVFFERLYDAAQSKGFSFEKYPALSMDFGRVVLQEEVRAEDLFAEIDLLTRQLLDRMAPSKKEKEIIALYQRYLLLQKMFSLSLSHSEYGEVKAQTSETAPSVMAERIQKLGSSRSKLTLSEIRSLDMAFNRAQDFYEEALLRDQVMFDRAVEKMKSEKKAAAVLITGGFHTPGLQRAMKNQGIAYVEVMPRINDLNDQGQKTYESIMTLKADTTTKRSYIASPRVLTDKVLGQAMSADTALAEKLVILNSSDIKSDLAGADYSIAMSEARSSDKKDILIVSSELPSSVDPAHVRQYLSSQSVSRRQFLLTAAGAWGIIGLLDRPVMAQLQVAAISAADQAKATFYGMVRLNEASTGLAVDKARISMDGKVQLIAGNVDYMKTSPTNMGLGILAVVIGAEQGWTAKANAEKHIEKVVTTLEKMKRVKGFWYNWYDLRDIPAGGVPQVALNQFVSSVDNGNLTASLMVAREAFDGTPVAARIQKLLDAQDWNFFYNKTTGFINHGYDASTGKLSEYDYGTFNTEARLSAFIASLNGVPEDVWSKMDMTVRPSKDGGKAVVASWGGSLFEALFADVFIGSTGAIRQNHLDTIQIHINKGKELGSAWGWSPSLNSRGEYKEFAVPEIGARDGGKGYPVGDVTPYSILLAAPYYPTEAMAALTQLRKMNADVYSPVFGYRDSIDPKTGRVAPDILSLDKGMELAGLDGMIQAGKKQSGTSEKYFWKYLARVRKAEAGKKLLVSANSKVSESLQMFREGKSGKTQKMERLKDLLDTSRAGDWYTEGQGKTGRRPILVTIGSEKVSAVQINYDVTPKGSFNGTSHQHPSGVLGVEGATHLLVRVKGNKETGYTKAFKIEIKSAAGKLQEFIVEGITDDWKEFALPLKKGLDAGSITEMVTVFENGRADVKKGAIMITDISLARPAARSEVRGKFILNPKSDALIVGEVILAPTRIFYAKRAEKDLARIGVASRNSIWVMSAKQYEQLESGADLSKLQKASPDSVSMLDNVDRYRRRSYKDMPIELHFAEGDVILIGKNSAKSDVNNDALAKVKIVTLNAEKNMEVEVFAKPDISVATDWDYLTATGRAEVRANNEPAKWKLQYSLRSLLLLMGSVGVLTGGAIYIYREYFSLNASLRDAQIKARQAAEEDANSQPLPDGNRPFLAKEIGQRIIQERKAEEAALGKIENDLGIKAADVEVFGYVYSKDGLIIDVKFNLKNTDIKIVYEYSPKTDRGNGDFILKGSPKDIRAQIEEVKSARSEARGSSYDDPEDEIVDRIIPNNLRDPADRIYDEDGNLTYFKPNNLKDPSERVISDDEESFYRSESRTSKNKPAKSAKRTFAVESLEDRRVMTSDLPGVLDQTVQVGSMNAGEQVNPMDSIIDSIAADVAGQQAEGEGQPGEIAYVRPVAGVPYKEFVTGRGLSLTGAQPIGISGGGAQVIQGENVLVSINTTTAGVNFGGGGVILKDPINAVGKRLFMRLYMDDLTQGQTYMVNGQIEVVDADGTSYKIEIADIPERVGQAAMFEIDTRNAPQDFDAAHIKRVFFIEVGAGKKGSGIFSLILKDPSEMPKVILGVQNGTISEPLSIFQSGNVDMVGIPSLSVFETANGVKADINTYASHDYAGLGFVVRNPQANGIPLSDLNKAPEAIQVFVNSADALPYSKIDILGPNYTRYSTYIGPIERNIPTLINIPVTAEMAQSISRIDGVVLVIETAYAGEVSLQFGSKTRQGTALVSPDGQHAVSYTQGQLIISDGNNQELGRLDVSFVADNFYAVTNNGIYIKQYDRHGNFLFRFLSWDSLINRDPSQDRNLLIEIKEKLGLYGSSFEDVTLNVNPANPHIIKFRVVGGTTTYRINLETVEFVYSGVQEAIDIVNIQVSNFLYQKYGNSSFETVVTAIQDIVLRNRKLDANNDGKANSNDILALQNYAYTFYAGQTQGFVEETSNISLTVYLQTGSALGYYIGPQYLRLSASQPKVEVYFPDTFDTLFLQGIISRANLPNVPAGWTRATNVDYAVQIDKPANAPQSAKVMNLKNREVKTIISFVSGYGEIESLDVLNANSQGKVYAVFSSTITANTHYVILKDVETATAASPNSAVLQGRLIEKHQSGDNFLVKTDKGQTLVNLANLGQALVKPASAKVIYSVSAKGQSQHELTVMDNRARTLFSKNYTSLNFQSPIDRVDAAIDNLIVDKNDGTVEVYIRGLSDAAASAPKIFNLTAVNDVSFTNGSLVITGLRADQKGQDIITINVLTGQSTTVSRLFNVVQAIAEPLTAMTQLGANFVLDGASNLRVIDIKNEGTNFSSKRSAYGMAGGDYLQDEGFAFTFEPINSNGQQRTADLSQMEALTFYALANNPEGAVRAEIISLNSAGVEEKTSIYVEGLTLDEYRKISLPLNQVADEIDLTRVIHIAFLQPSATPSAMAVIAKNPNGEISTASNSHYAVTVIGNRDLYIFPKSPAQGVFSSPHYSFSPTSHPQINFISKDGSEISVLQLNYPDSASRYLGIAPIQIANGTPTPTIRVSAQFFTGNTLKANDADYLAAAFVSQTGITQVSQLVTVNKKTGEEILYENINPFDFYLPAPSANTNDYVVMASQITSTSVAVGRFGLTQKDSALQIINLPSQSSSINLKVEVTDAVNNIFMITVNAQPYYYDAVRNQISQSNPAPPSAGEAESAVPDYAKDAVITGANPNFTFEIPVTYYQDPGNPNNVIAGYKVIAVNKTSGKRFTVVIGSQGDIPQLAGLGVDPSGKYALYAQEIKFSNRATGAIDHQILLTVHDLEGRFIGQKYFDVPAELSTVQFLSGKVEIAAKDGRKVSINLPVSTQAAAGVSGGEAVSTVAPSAANANNNVILPTNNPNYFYRLSNEMINVSGLEFSAMDILDQDHNVAARIENEFTIQGPMAYGSVKNAVVPTVSAGGKLIAQIRESAVGVTDEQGIVQGFHELEILITSTALGSKRTILLDDTRYGRPQILEIPKAVYFESETSLLVKYDRRILRFNLNLPGYELTPDVIDLTAPDQTLISDDLLNLLAADQLSARSEVREQSESDLEDYLSQYGVTVQSVAEVMRASAKIASIEYPKNIVEALLDAVAPETADGYQNPVRAKAMQAAREAMGDYAWMLNTKEPVHLATPVNAKDLNAQDLAALSILFSQGDLLRLVIPGISDAQAKAIAQAAEKEALKLGNSNFAETISLNASGSAENEIAGVLKRVAAGKLFTSANSAMLDSRMKVLDAVGATRSARLLSPSNIDETIAVVITAALLRQQMPETYTVKDLEQWLSQNKIDIRDVAKHVSQMIQAVKRIAAAA